MNYSNDYNGKVIFSKNLKTLLKQKIKGEVYCHLSDDTLVVDISSTHKTYWKYTLPNLSSEIVHGLTSETLSITIVKQYTNFIRNLYFL